MCNKPKVKRKENQKKNLLDKVWVFDQIDSTPERIVDGGPMLFELRGESPIGDGAASRILYQMMQHLPFLALHATGFSLQRRRSEWPARSLPAYKDWALLIRKKDGVSVIAMDFSNLHEIEF